MKVNYAFKLNSTLNVLISGYVDDVFLKDQ